MYSIVVPYWHTHPEIALSNRTDIEEKGFYFENKRNKRKSPNKKIIFQISGKPMYVYNYQCRIRSILIWIRIRPKIEKIQFKKKILLKIYFSKK